VARLIVRRRSQPAVKRSQSALKAHRTSRRPGSQAFLPKQLISRKWGIPERRRFAPPRWRIHKFALKWYNPVSRLIHHGVIGGISFEGFIQSQTPCCFEP
jgi:hypothetical protein